MHARATSWQRVAWDWLTYRERSGSRARTHRPHLHRQAAGVFSRARRARRSRPAHARPRHPRRRNTPALHRRPPPHRRACAMNARRIVDRMRILVRISVHPRAVWAMMARHGIGLLRGREPPPTSPSPHPPTWARATSLTGGSTQRSPASTRCVCTSTSKVGACAVAFPMHSRTAALRCVPVVPPSKPSRLNTRCCGACHLCLRAGAVCHQEVQQPPCQLPASPQPPMQRRPQPGPCEPRGPRAGAKRQRGQRRDGWKAGRGSQVEPVRPAAAPGERGPRLANRLGTGAYVGRRETWAQSQPPSPAPTITVARLPLIPGQGLCGKGLHRCRAAAWGLCERLHAACRLLL